MGANTFYIVSSDSWSGSPTLNGPKSDKDGKFEILGRYGPSIAVWVTDDRYYSAENAVQQFAYASPGPLVKVGGWVPTQNSPAIFVLKRKGVSANLVHHDGITLTLPDDGSQVSVSVRSGRINDLSDSIAVGLTSQSNQLPLNVFHPFEWSVTFQVPDGGLIKRSDLLNFQAPDDGYNEMDTVVMSPVVSGAIWTSAIQVDYFVSFKSGNFGRVHLEVSGERNRATIDTFYNPVPGDHNLEFDPTKAIRSP